MLGSTFCLLVDYCPSNLQVDIHMQMVVRLAIAYNIKHMNNLEDQSTLSDFPAFQPLVARFVQHHRVMDFRTLPLEALLSTLTFQEDDTSHRDTQRKDQKIEYPSNHITTTTDSEESEWGIEGRKGLEKKKHISKKNEQNRKLKTK